MKVLLYFRQSQNITREKLPKRLSYEKGVRKTLMKLTPAVFKQYSGTPTFNLLLNTYQFQKLAAS